MDRIWHGLAWQARCGLVRRGKDWQGLARNGAAGGARIGVAGQGSARNGKRFYKENMMKMVEKIAIELDRIVSDNGGILRAADVVAYARNKRTALHGRFQWDDSKAAHAHRLEQARDIIQVTVKLLPNVDTVIRSFVSLGSDRERGGGYRDIVSVMSNKRMRDELLGQALREMDAWRDRYNQIKELVPVFSAMDRVKSRRKKSTRKQAVSA